MPFKNPDDTYKKGTSFEKVYRIYEFDAKLRHILFSALEEIEIYLRSTISYFHAHKHGATGYLDRNNFSKAHDHKKFTAILKREITNNAKELFVQHHIKNYGGVFPIWVITELFTFGMLSYFYADMTTQDKKAFAKTFGLNYKHMVSYLRCCTDLRNFCAHYGRLYYRIFSAVPAAIPVADKQKRRLFSYVVVIKLLYPNTNKWNNEILPSLQNLIQAYLKDISLKHIGFPKDWDLVLKK